jgi:hypothetical protein
LVQADHLRFFAALDSNIGTAKVEDGEDFDNAYTGKNETLIDFVTRHRKNVDVVRHDKAFTDLEAVFVNFEPDMPKHVEPEIRKRAHNLFHTPH